MKRPRCERTGKRRFTSSLEVILNYQRGARKMTRPYLCPFCSSWHASSQPARKVA